MAVKDCSSAVNEIKHLFLVFNLSVLFLKKRFGSFHYYGSFFTLVVAVAATECSWKYPHTKKLVEKLNFDGECFSVAKLFSTTSVFFVVFRS